MPPRLFFPLPLVRDLESQNLQCNRAFFCTGRRVQAANNPVNDLIASLETPSRRAPPRSSPSRPPPRPTSTPSTSPANPSPVSATAAWFLRNTISRSSRAEARRSSLEQIAAAGERQDMERQLIRKWRVGDVYAPHDLSFQEQRKWKNQRNQGRPGEKVSGRNVDVFDEFAMDPVREYKNFALLSEYMSEMGRIKHSRETGLRPVNQRKIAKAIRRAIGIGIMPSVHTHPELMPERVNYRQDRLMSGSLGASRR